MIMTTSKLAAAQAGQFMSSRASAQQKSPAEVAAGSIGGKTPQIQLPSLMQNTATSGLGNSSGNNIPVHP